MSTIETILGVRFLDADVHVALQCAKDGALIVVPSGPGLAALGDDKRYREALLGADVAIVDSFLLALSWWVLTRHRLHRVSGLKFLRAFLEQKIGAARGELFIVNPNDSEAEVNQAWLRTRGYEIPGECCYTAPAYSSGEIEDAKLVALLEQHRPRFVLLNIGGGVQEPLGFYLKRALSYRPAIICTGAAIAFLTGKQARIPTLVDHLGLGWLARCVQDPAKFVPRYLDAARLAPLVLKHKRELPPLRTHQPGQAK